MSTTVVEIEEAALALPPRDRAILAEHLITSLDGEKGEDFVDYDEMWLKEAESRYQAYRAGRLTSRPASDVVRDAIAKLQCRK